MDNHSLEHGHAALVISAITGFFGWMNSMQISELLKNFSMSVSIIAGIMAIRYYWYSVKKLKK